MAGMYMVEGGRLVQFNEKKFDNEKVFQELLAQHPGLLAGELVDPAVPRRWLLVRREPPLRDEEGSLYADHLYLDQDGIPTLVEVKRAADTRTRREVVAQMLDYATRVISLDVRDVQQQFNEWHPNAESDLADFVQGDIDSFWEKVSTNLSAKKIRMLFVADEIPPRLRQIIEFLNEQMRPAQVLGIEIRRYETEAREAFVPAVIGRTTTAVSRKASSAGTERTVEDFRNLFWADSRPSKETPEDTARARPLVGELLNWCERHGLQTSVSRADGNPSLGIRLVRDAPSANVTLQADAGLSFNLKNIEPFMRDPSAFASLNSKIQTAIGRDVLAPNRQTAKLYDLTEQQLTNLLVVLDWAIDQSEARQRST